MFKLLKALVFDNEVAWPLVKAKRKAKRKLHEVQMQMQQHHADLVHTNKELLRLERREEKLIAQIEKFDKNLEGIMNED